ncbi:ankyrin repeat-containing domain protein [Obelidium mucronatum]|nr:ankyrin repeat-containing domain protein [Obelidium mucronatum]
MLEIPLEVSELIVRHLPVDKHLTSIGFASSSFGGLIFFNQHSANSHFTQWTENPLNQKSLISLETSAEAWNSLPFIYKCASYNRWFLTGGSKREWYLNPMTRSVGLRLHNHFKVSNPTYSYGYQYFSVATYRGLLEVVQECAEVLPRRPSFDLTDCLPSLINQALGRNHSDLAHFLINLACFDPAARDGEILSTVAGKNQSALVEKVLKDPRIDKVILNIGLYSLKCAVWNGHFEVIQCMMEDPRIRRLEKESNEACCSALCEDNPIWAIVQYFVGLDGFDPSVRDSAILSATCSSGNMNLFYTFFQDPRVDPAACSDCIRSAAVNGRVEMLQVLLDDGRADPAHPDNEDSLSYASSQGFFEVVDLLLRDGRMDPSGNENAPVIGAVENGSLELVRLLLADPRVDPSGNGNEAIHIAVVSGKLELVNELLLDERVDPETATWQPAMHWAAIGGHVSIMKRLLLDSRVDPAPLILEANVDWFLEVADILSQDSRLGPNEISAVSELKTIVAAFQNPGDVDPSTVNLPFERRRTNEILQRIVREHKLK